MSSSVIHLGLILVTGLSNAVGLLELNDTMNGTIKQSFSKTFETTISSIECTNNQSCYSISNSNPTSNSLNECRTVSDDDFYVDDFESDADDDHLKSNEKEEST